MFYPKVKKAPKADFQGFFKHYEPDILIPELRTAVEYKYARDKKTLDDYLDEVKVDANNYKSDWRYENFVAVLCIDDPKISTEANIGQAWKDKKFPKNWDLVVVFL
jgi:hypothetical protein